MYESHDRPDTKRIIITVLVAVAVLAAMLLGAGYVLAALIATPATTPAAVSELPTGTVEPEIDPQTTAASTLPAEAPEPVEVEAPEPAAPAPAPSQASGVVCIDAGHQARGDSTHEPIGPGSSQTKPRVASGTRGVSTGNAESEVNLAVALKLRDELESRGVKVVMVRETEAVNLSNSERAAVANNASADLFVRLHCDGAESSSANGISMLVPGSNQWTGPIEAESGKAGKLVLDGMVAATGAKNNGVKKRTDIAGFNWSKVPVILPEMGFMTNPAEDAKLGSAEYQQKLAKGMADGIVRYLD